MDTIEEEMFVFDDKFVSNMKLLGMVILFIAQDSGQLKTIFENFPGQSTKGCKNFTAIHDTEGIEVLVRKWEFDLEKLQFKCPISCQNIAKTKCDDHGSGCTDIKTIENELRARTDFIIKNVRHSNLVNYVNINITQGSEGKLIVLLAQEYIDGISIKRSRKDYGKSYNIVDIAREVLKAIECLNNINERITHDFLNTGSIFVDKSGKYRVSDYHLVPYLMYLKRDQFLLNQCSDFVALAAILKSENEANYKLANDFIDQCRSKELLFADNLLKHSFITNAACRHVKTFQDDDRLLDDFYIQKYLGGGSFGQVFEARNLIDKKLYAIKMIAIPEEQSHRNKMEVLSKLNHKYIVKYITSWKQSVDLTELNELIFGNHPAK